jgi:Protein of unknown function (DUF3987)/Toprim domain/CHC2 zinc finger
VAVRFSPSEVKAYYATRAPHLKLAGAELRGPCPVHRGKRPSFAVNPNTGEAYCHSQCVRGWDIISLEQELTGASFVEACAAIGQVVGRDIGVPQRREVAVYSYQSETRELLFQTVRFDPKDFRQRRPNGKGGWISDLQNTRLVIYRLPELLKRPSETVFVCEGEKDADALEAIGFLATCNPMGAGKWRNAFSECLRGRRVVVIPDNDPATDENGKPHYKGQKHAAAVAESLLRHDCEVRIVELPQGKDAADWLSAGGTRDRLEESASAQPLLTPATLELWRAKWEPRSAAADWPDPAPIQDDLPPVQRFDENLLPAALRPFVRDVAERMQVPPDYPAALSILALAGAVNRRAVIQPKENDTGWRVVPNLWGGIVAPPGFLKSPVIQAVVRPLVEIQQDWRLAHELEHGEYERAKEEAELKHAAWKEEFKKSSKQNKPAPERPDSLPVQPVLRRLIVNDATFEALHQTMNENPAGILVVRDELTGWWSTLDRQGREGERAFCLQAWNGDTGHTIDRIGRGTIHVAACCMSMLGGIQPSRLRSYLVDALYDGPANDGLIQRFQILVWPDTVRNWEYIDRSPDRAIQERIEQIFRTLVRLGTASPLVFRFASDAQLLFVDWLRELEAKVRGNDLHPALISHLSKFRRLMPSLALLFELADRAANGVPITESTELLVSLEHAKQAAAFCAYLESHANRIYSCVTTSQVRAAQELGSKIKAGRVGANGFFTPRDIYLKGWSGLDTPDLARSAIQILEDASWVRSVQSEPSPAGGRPSLRYQINPRVRS